MLADEAQCGAMCYAANSSCVGGGDMMRLAAPPFPSGPLLRRHLRSRLDRVIWPGARRMGKTTRRAGKRATAAGRGVVRTRKSGVSKAGKPGLRKPKPAKTDPRKQKSSLRSEMARMKRQLNAARMQQRASAEILRAVANASGDAAGPLQLIAETTARLFKASSVSIQLAEGSEFTQEYRVGAIAKRVGSAYPRSDIKVGGRNLPGTVVAESSADPHSGHRPA